MSPELSESLDYPSKLSRHPAHIGRLIADGEAQAAAFLDELGSDPSPTPPNLWSKRSRSTSRSGAAVIRRRSRRRRCCCRCLPAARVASRRADQPPPPALVPAAPRPPSPDVGDAARRAAASRRRPPKCRTLPAPDAAAPRRARPRAGAPRLRRPAGELGAAALGRGLRARVDAAPAAVPFRLRLNHVSQFKYTNSLATQHDLRRSLRRRARRPAPQRHPARARRLLFLRLRVRSAAGLQHPGLHVDAPRWSATAAGYVGFVFDKAFALRAGFFSLPSVRSHDRDVSVLSRHRPQHGDNYFRPGLHAGRVGQRRAAARLQLHRDDRQLAEHARHQVDRASTTSSPTPHRSGTTCTTSARTGTTTSTTTRWRCASARAFTYAREDRLSRSVGGRPGEQRRPSSRTGCSCSRPARSRRT